MLSKTDKKCKKWGKILYGCHCTLHNKTLNYSSKLRDIMSKISSKSVKEYGEFDIFLTVHHSIDFFQVTKLMHNSFIL